MAGGHGESTEAPARATRGLRVEAWIFLTLTGFFVIAAVILLT